MADDPTNGGRRINQLEQKSLVTDTVINELVKQVSHTNEILERYFGPDGFCARHQRRVERNMERIESNRAWIKALWAVAIAVGLAITSVAIKVMIS